MSLKEAYQLAHTAQCRLNIAANRPDRNLRFVVGHLMHYEALRLRIVEIEHDVSQSHHAKSVQFKGTGHVCQEIPRKPSTGQLGRKSPPPPPVHVSSSDEESDHSDHEEEEGEGLSLQRFPSGAAHPPRHLPDLTPDDLDELSGSDEDDDDGPVTPEEPDQETVELALKGGNNDLLAKMYEGVRNCPCHGKTEAPSFESLYELPQNDQTKQGWTRAVAQVSTEA